MVWAFGNQVAALRRVRRTREVGRDHHAGCAKSWRSFLNKRSRWFGGRTAVPVADVQLDAMLAARYYDHLTGMTIDFFRRECPAAASSRRRMSALAAKFASTGLTGGVDVVSHRPL
jgi:hypothetical protein